MAKVSFTKLGVKLNTEIKAIEFNEQVIEVKQYLPINEKLEMISTVLNLSAGDYSFANPVQVEILTALEMIYAYTNINFTEKQKAEPAKLYDAIKSSGLMQIIFDAIPQEEYENVVAGVNITIDAFYAYKNSVVGILDTMSSDYSNLNLDAEAIKAKIGNPENLELLRAILTKLG